MTINEAINHENATLVDVRNPDEVAMESVLGLSIFLLTRLLNVGRNSSTCQDLWLCSAVLVGAQEGA